MSAVYVVGGRQKPDAHHKEHWHRSAEAVVLSVDLKSGAIEECVRHVSPRDACADDDPSFIFKAGTLVNHRLYVCSQTELVVYNIPSFERESYLSHPWFNDVHHVRPGANGTYLVANTGLDMVMELDDTGAVLREWSTVSTDMWERFSRDVDYRPSRSRKRSSLARRVSRAGFDLAGRRRRRRPARPRRSAVDGAERVGNHRVFGPSGRLQPSLWPDRAGNAQHRRLREPGPEDRRRFALNTTANAF